MTRTASQGTTVAVTNLNDAIADVVRLQQQKASIDAAIENGRELIARAMKAAGFKRHATASGEEALLYDSHIYTFDVKTLDGALSRARFEKLCPRKPDGAALRKLIEADPVLGPKIAKCAEIKLRETLVVRPAQAVGDAQPATATTGGDACSTTTTGTQGGLTPKEAKNFKKPAELWPKRDVPGQRMLSLEPVGGELARA